MQWWISPSGTVAGPFPASQQISYENAGYKGPYPTRGAAQTALNSGGPASSAPWWVIWSMASPDAGQITSKVEQLAKAPALNGGSVYSVQGPFSTKAEAQSAAGNPSDPKATNPGGIKSVTGLAAIADFFSRLSQGHTWERIGQVALGVILFAIGLARMTRAVPIATKIAKMAGAAAVL